MKQLERLEATVRGNVQGVGFRWFVKRRAAELGLTGWVANEPQGTVRVVAEGDSAALDDLADLLAEGPPGARVEAVDAQRLAATNSFARFEIRSGAHRGD